MKIIAIIPARGGSKRIPHKNITDFCGIPMIAWTIKAAQECAFFDKVLVSTDDEDIQKISKQFGADVPFLREQASDDFSPVSEATISALHQAESFWDTKYDIIVQLMANCPLRGSQDIKKSIDSFLEKSRDFQISAINYGWMNPWWASTINEKGEAKQLFPEASLKRSQDLPELLCPTGAIWVAKREALLKSCSFYGPNYCLEEMDWIDGTDIDTTNDLKVAKSLHILREKKL